MTGRNVTSWWPKQNSAAKKSIISYKTCQVLWSKEILSYIFIN